MVTQQRMSGRISIIAAACASILLSPVLAMGQCEPSADPTCQTIVPGGPVSGTWTLAGSPYCVEGDIRVAGLTIEPGVCVKINGPYRIDVETTIMAVGTETEPISFIAGVSGVRWKGMFFDNLPAGSSNLTHCVIRWAEEAGLTLINAVPILNNCTIKNNDQVTGNGGGIRAFIDDGDLELVKCTVSDNRARDHGGGIYAVMGTGKLVLADCIVAANRNNYQNASGNYQGGGIRLDGDSFFKRCRIEGNTCTSVCSGIGDRFSKGGGVYLLRGAAEIENSVISDNLAQAIAGGCTLGDRTALGGGIYLEAGSLELANSVLSCNALSAPTLKRGGGLYHAGGASRVVNSTIVLNNQEGIYRAAGTVEVRNSIVWGNGGNELGPGTNVTAEYSCVEGSPVYPGMGNINFSPGFAGPGCCLHDLVPLPGSFSIDVGDPDPQYNDVCFPPSQGTTRNDMGATGGPLACEWGCLMLFADVNRDQVVGFADVILILAGWGPCSGCPGDINCDGTVGFADVLEVLANWGDTCS